MLLPLAANFMLTRHPSAAALSWLLYDMILTIGDEVNYIWSRRWSTFTALFFIVRYVPLLAVTSSALTSLLPDVAPGVCDIFSWIEAGCTFVILVVVQGERVLLLFGCLR